MNHSKIAIEIGDSAGKEQASGKVWVRGKTTRIAYTYVLRIGTDD